MYLSVCLAIYVSSCPSNYLSICPSIDLSIYLSICLSVYLCIYLCVYLSIYRPVYVSIYLSIYLIYRSIYLSIDLSIYLSLYLSLRLSIYLSLYVSIYLSMYRSMHLSMYLSIYLSIYRSIVVVVVVVVVGVVVVVVVVVVAAAVVVAVVVVVFVFVVAVAVVVEVRVVTLVKLLKLVKLVKLISVYFFDICTSKKAQNPQFFTLLTSKCASRHNGVHFFDTFSTSEPPKVVRDRQFLTLLTWKCASRHNGVHFFDIATSKSGPNLVCFVHFDLEMCFAPQRRALFRHRNFQKWSGAEVYCTFWLGNVLRATTACNFSSLLWPCSWVRTRCFSEPTFRPSGATNHWKNTVFRDFPTFSRICIFCPLTLSLLIFSLLIFLFSLPLPCSAFHLSILSEVWLLNFLRLSIYSTYINYIIYVRFAFYNGCHQQSENEKASLYGSAGNKAPITCLFGHWLAPYV